MTIDCFKQLAPRVQLVVVLSEGTRIAAQQQGRFTLTLYYVPDGGRGFFAEVGVNATLQRIVVLRSLGSSALLEEYTQGVQLPEAEL